MQAAVEKCQSARERHRTVTTVSLTGTPARDSLLPQSRQMVFCRPRVGLQGLVDYWVVRSNATAPSSLFFMDMCHCFVALIIGVFIFCGWKDPTKSCHPQKFHFILCISWTKDEMRVIVCCHMHVHALHAYTLNYSLTSYITDITNSDSLVH